MNTFSTQSFDLTNKNVVVTGSAGILGPRLVRALLIQGAQVIAIDRNPEGLDDLKKQIEEELSPKLLTIKGDITDREDLLAAKQQVLSQFDAIDVLFNNAATKSENFFEPFESFPLSDWQQVMKVNTEGLMLSCQIFGGHMAQSEQAGSIINTLSIYGIVAPDQRIYEGSQYLGRPINTPAVYSTSKAAVWGLTK